MGHILNALERSLVLNAVVEKEQTSWATARQRTKQIPLETQKRDLINKFRCMRKKYPRALTVGEAAM